MFGMSVACVAAILFCMVCVEAVMFTSVIALIISMVMRCDGALASAELPGGGTACSK